MREYCKQCKWAVERCVCPKDESQTLLFDAQAAKKEAVDRVERHASKDWMAAARAAVVVVAKKMEHFTTDDVWAELDMPARERRAMGAVMRKSSIDKVCSKTDRVQDSKRVECHGRPVAIWRSHMWPGRKA